MRHGFFGLYKYAKPSIKAREISRHDAYVLNADVVYTVKVGDPVVARGNVEFLNAVYNDVPFALKGYWKRRKEDERMVGNIKRYLILHGMHGSLREFLHQRLSSSDQDTIRWMHPDDVQQCLAYIWSHQM